MWHADPPALRQMTLGCFSTTVQKLPLYRVDGTRRPAFPEQRHTHDDADQARASKLGNCMTRTHLYQQVSALGLGVLRMWYSPRAAKHTSPISFCRNSVCTEVHRSS